MVGACLCKRAFTQADFDGSPRSAEIRVTKGPSISPHVGHRVTMEVDSGEFVVSLSAAAAVRDSSEKTEYTSGINSQIDQKVPEFSHQLVERSGVVYVSADDRFMWTGCRRGRYNIGRVAEGVPSASRGPQLLQVAPRLLAVCYICSASSVINCQRQAASCRCPFSLTRR